MASNGEPMTPSEAYEECEAAVKAMAKDFASRYRKGLTEEDLEQEGFLAILKHAAEYDKATGNKPWTFFQWFARTAMNEHVRKHLRSRAEEIPSADHDYSSDDRSCNGHPIHRGYVTEAESRRREEATDTIAAVLERAKLTDEQRKLFAAYHNGATMAELAATLNRSEATVSRWLKRIREQVERSLSA